MLDKDSNTPLYIQLYNMFKEKIESGDVQAGWKLPSENELCEKYKISRSTIRQTLSELEKFGFIYKAKGKGSFVSVRPFPQDLNSLYNFSDEIKKHGKKPKYHLINLDLIIPDKTISTIMNLTYTDKVYKIQIIRKIEDEPILFETTYLPEKRFKNFENVNLNKRSLYDVLRYDYNVIFSNAKQTFYPILASNKVKEYLDASKQKPLACMNVERLSYEKENIIEYTISLVKGEKFRYTINLTN
ncbi:GntR family transcriptional regulator [Clostridium botulinum]|uniref:GntR family transcriptional regulator n=1 Tax=Clostridium botulinum TaxID=1491 RepID=A0A9Q1UW79_CLOBO|nr:GntR family transcriptional regulator [Clostridium botulinum]AEB76731.1 transcription regulator, GntR family, putative [Clostridium botulinum BKT015925]KEH98768.1 GntR family transcriptional regulator [Clostridium botulinum D str. 16868]KEI03123.1 GntR family transcriptional regulator [Clostridium botulinum C/D str. Sp77]KLU76655.1 GntR family transcriptional regulator [Clostridium botulinum V891]KOA73798.1 GntR family transcriptional regulator [Clostridium botulinum]